MASAAGSPSPVDTAFGPDTAWLALLHFDRSHRRSGAASVLWRVVALRHRWPAFGTDDDAVTMFIGPSTNAEPHEIGVVTDNEGSAVIHAMPARQKFLKGRWQQ